MWSRNLMNEETLAHWGAIATPHQKKITSVIVCTVFVCVLAEFDDRLLTLDCALEWDLVEYDSRMWSCRCRSLYSQFLANIENICSWLSSELRWFVFLVCNCKTRDDTFLIQLNIFHLWLFLGAFAKFGKAIISFSMSVCPSVRMEQLGFYWKNCHLIWHLNVFSKICRQNSTCIQIWQE